jgi:hypothetical protein
VGLSDPLDLDRTATIKRKGTHHLELGFRREIIQQSGSGSKDGEVPAASGHRRGCGDALRDAVVSET